MIGSIAPGKSVEVTVLRDGKLEGLHGQARRTAGCRASRLRPTRMTAQPQQSDSETLADLGLTVTRPMTARAWSSPMSSPAATPPIAACRPATSSPASTPWTCRGAGDVTKAIDEAAKAGRKAVLVQMTRERRQPLRGAARRQGLIALRFPGHRGFLAEPRPEDPQRLRVASHPWAVRRRQVPSPAAAIVRQRVRDRLPLRGPISRIEGP